MLPVDSWLAVALIVPELKIVPTVAFGLIRIAVAAVSTVDAVTVP